MSKSAAAWYAPPRSPTIPFTHPAVMDLVRDPIVREARPANDCEILRPVIRHQTEFVGVFDTETTGREGNARIVEIVVSKARVSDGAIVETFGSLVNPGVAIPFAAQAVHHISDAMVARAPSIAEVLPRFFAFVREHGLVLVAHNAPFDRKVIAYEAQRTDTSLPGTINVYCSLAASRKLRTPKGTPPSHALQAMAADYGIRVESAHRAGGDVATLAIAVSRLMGEPKAQGKDFREAFPLSGVL